MVYKYVGSGVLEDLLHGCHLEAHTFRAGARSSCSGGRAGQADKLPLERLTNEVGLWSPRLRVPEASVGVGDMMSRAHARAYESHAVVPPAVPVPLDTRGLSFPRPASFSEQ
jgi:hypothetical protein